MLQLWQVVYLIVIFVSNPVRKIQLHAAAKRDESVPASGHAEVSHASTKQNTPHKLIKVETNN